MQAAANKALASLSEAGEKVSQAIVTSGMLQCVKQQLDGTDSDIKTTGLDAVANVAQQSAALATACADEDLLDKAIALLNEPTAREKLQENVCVMLSAISAHTAELAKKTLDHGAVDAAVNMLQPEHDTQPKLQAAALHCLAHISCHESSSASVVSAAGTGEAAIRLAATPNPALRHAATSLLHQIASRTAQLCKSIASGGCVTALIAALRLDQGTAFAVAPLLALGHIGSSAPTFAQAVRWHSTHECLGTVYCFAINVQRRQAAGDCCGRDPRVRSCTARWYRQPCEGCSLGTAAQRSSWTSHCNTMGN